MAEQTVEDYIRTTFTPGSRPSKRTVWAWIRSGRLPAVRRGKRYFIQTEQSVESCGNPLADRVLHATPPSQKQRSAR